MTAFIEGFAMRFTTALLLCLAVPGAAMAQAPAPASAAAQVKTGAKVFDTSGGEVGTIDAVNGDVAVVATGTNKVSIPTASFGAGATGAGSGHNQGAARRRGQRSRRQVGRGGESRVEARY